MFPLARTDDILAGFYVAEDGQANPVDVTMSLARGARMQGATIVEGVPVTGVLHERGAVTGVRTPYGDIECEYVVNCAGMWARQLGAARGRQHPAAGRRALLPHHRADPRSQRVVPRARGPGFVRVLPRRGRWAARRLVRAGVRAVERRRSARRLLLRRDRTRLRAHGAVRREGDGAGADHRRGRREEVLLRPRELHSRPATRGRRGAGAEELLRRGRAQLDRHPHRWRARPRRRALGR